MIWHGQAPPLLRCQESPLPGKQSLVVMTFEQLGPRTEQLSPHIPFVCLRSTEGRQIGREKREREGKDRRKLATDCGTEGEFLWEQEYAPCRAIRSLRGNG